MDQAQDVGVVAGEDRDPGIAHQPQAPSGACLRRFWERLTTSGPPLAGREPPAAIGRWPITPSPAQASASRC